MKCHYCGATLSDKDIFCIHCGTRQQQAPKTEPATPIPVQMDKPVQAAPVPELDVPVIEVPSLEVKEIPFPWNTPVYQEKPIDWQPYGAPAKEEPLLDFKNSPFAQAPALKLPTKRSLWKMILFGILTMGIYPTVIWSRLVGEVNLTASRYDGERSMPFFAMALLAPVTLGIHSLVWINKLCRRIGKELRRRSIPYTFGPSDFWLWAFLLSAISSICLGICAALITLRSDTYIIIWILLAVALLALVGPFVFITKLMRAMNRLNEDFNSNG